MEKSNEKKEKEKPIKKVKEHGNERELMEKEVEA